MSSDRSRSPNRSSDRSRSKSRRTGREKDNEPRENNVTIDNQETLILKTPFTFGMEWEPNIYGQYYTKDDNAYDRQTIFETSTKKLKVSIEDFNLENYDDEEKKNACKYNIEMVSGVFGLDNKVSINDFLLNPNYFMDDIKRELTDFETDFFDKQKENLRAKVVSPNLIANNGYYKDCDFLVPITDENIKDINIGYTKDFNILNNFVGRPQITIGLSYALFEPLLNFSESNVYTKISDFIWGNEFEKIFPEKEIKDTIFYPSLGQTGLSVFRGFALVIFYFCTKTSSYYSKKIARLYQDGEGGDYFKSAFPLKPRSNLAESYKNLKSEYNNFVQLLDLFYEKISSTLTDKGIYFDISQANANESFLIEFRLSIIETLIIKS